MRCKKGDEIVRFCRSDVVEYGSGGSENFLVNQARHELMRVGVEGGGVIGMNVSFCVNL